MSGNAADRDSSIFQWILSTYGASVHQLSTEPYSSFSVDSTVFPFLP